MAYPFNAEYNPYNYTEAQMGRGKLPDDWTGSYTQQNLPDYSPYWNSQSPNSVAGDTSVAGNTFEMPTDIQPYSGLPPGYRDQLMNIVMPQLGQSLGDMSGNINQFQQQAGNAFTPVDQNTFTPVNQTGTYTPVNPNTFTPVDLQGAYGQIDESTQQALGGFRQQLQNYLKEMIPRDINQLANRGVLSSTVAENMLSDTAAKGARDASTRGYETLMAAAGQKAALGGQAALTESQMRSNFAQQAAMANAQSQNQFSQQAALQNAQIQNQQAQQAAMQNATTQNQQRYNTAMQSALMRNNIPNTLAGLLQYGQSSQDPTVMYRTMAELLASL